MLIGKLTHTFSIHITNKKSCLSAYRNTYRPLRAGLVHQSGKVWHSPWFFTQGGRHFLCPSVWPKFRSLHRTLLGLIYAQKSRITYARETHKLCTPLRINLCHPPKKNMSLPTKKYVTLNHIFCHHPKKLRTHYMIYLMAAKT